MVLRMSSPTQAEHGICLAKFVHVHCRLYCRLSLTHACQWRRYATHREQGCTASTAIISLRQGGLSGEGARGGARARSAEAANKPARW